MNAINILGIVGIIAAFILLTILIMKGLNIFLTVFICTLVVAVTTRMPIYGAFKTNFMVGFSSFFQNYFLLFLTGTLLAKASRSQKRSLSSWAPIWLLYLCPLHAVCWHTAVLPPMCALSVCFRLRCRCFGRRIFLEG